MLGSKKFFLIWAQQNLFPMRTLLLSLLIAFPITNCYPQFGLRKAFDEIKIDLTSQGITYHSDKGLDDLPIIIAIFDGSIRNYYFDSQNTCVYVVMVPDNTLILKAFINRFNEEGKKISPTMWDYSSKGRTCFIKLELDVPMGSSTINRITFSKVFFK